MARIIGGIGSSHVPALGPAIDRKLDAEPDWKPVFDGFAPARSWLARHRPDVAIVIYNDHGLDFFIDKMPTFAVGACAEYAHGDEGWGVRPYPPLPGDPELSWHIIERLVDDEFDVTICQELVVDHGALVPMTMLFAPAGDWPIRIVPLAVNVIQHPQPTAARCYKLGLALRRALLAYRADISVVIIGTGGMSHQLALERAGFINEPFDAMFFDQIERDPDALTRITRAGYQEQAGTEGLELIMWLAMRGSLAPIVTRRHRFYHRTVSMTATGCIVLEEPHAATVPTR